MICRLFTWLVMVVVNKKSKLCICFISFKSSSVTIFMQLPHDLPKLTHVAGLNLKRSSYKHLWYLQYKNVKDSLVISDEKLCFWVEFKYILTKTFVSFLSYNRRHHHHLRRVLGSSANPKVLSSMRPRSKPQTHTFEKLEI